MNVATRTQPELTPEFLGRGPIPTEPYRSAAYFELEREHIFRRVWLMVGREDEAQQPGDYVVKEVEVCNASVLIVRGADNTLRAFHNICSHRGNKLAWDERGHTKQFVCNYHAWSYSLEGELRAATDAQMFFNLDKAACRLNAIHLDCWNGWIFVNFSAQPQQSLKAFLGGLGEKLNDYPFARFTDYLEFSGVFEANWKIAVDAFQESYHLGYMHKNSIGPQFAAGINPGGRMISTQFFGDHRSGSIWGNGEFKPRPIEATAFAFSTLIAGRDATTDEQNSLPASINPTGDPNWVVEMNCIFPNNQLFVSRQGVLVHSYWPLSHDATRWYCRLYYRPLKTARQLFAQQFQACLSRDTFLEDAATIRRIGDSLKSGALKQFHYQDNEAFPRHLYHVVEQYVRKGIAQK